MYVFITLFLFALQSEVYGQGCSCSSTGISNGVETGVKGCTLASDRASTPTCFVETSRACPRARQSRTYQGASFVSCSTREALLYAAEIDDVESIVRFRKRGVNLNVAVDVEGRTYSLLAYAAAHGSFRVVEDLVINEDFECDNGIDVVDALCTLNDETKCDRRNDQRASILILINHIYRPKCVHPEDREPRAAAFITRSVPASCGKHPYFVSVRSSFSGGYAHRCGGVLIYPDTVITAAHCVDGSTGQFDPVLLIESYSLDDGFGSPCTQQHEVRKGVKIVLHPKWSKSGKFFRTVGNGNDVALIKLNAPSKKKPIKISSKKKPTVGETLHFVGFGQTSGGGSFSDELQIVSIKAAKTSTCKSAYTPNGVANNILCIGGSDKDFCNGDEGGPLIRRKSSGDELVGIAHLKHPTFGCGSIGIPGLYANVPKLNYWINKQRKKKF